MDTTSISRNHTTVEEYSLSELQQWLQYTKHTWSLGASGIFLPYSLILWGLKIIAILFTPYMLWHLYQAKWNKSVFVLLFVVVLPFIVTQFLRMKYNWLYFLLLFLPFLNFYLYTYIISFMIREQLTKIQTLAKWKREEMSY